MEMDGASFAYKTGEHWPMATSRSNNGKSPAPAGRSSLAGSTLVARRAPSLDRSIEFKPRRAPYVSAKAVGSFVPGLTKKSFEKFGFATAQLITDWATVAGVDVARYTVPERIRWPRLPMGSDDDSDGNRAATLMLRVDPARAFDIEYKRAQLIERINVYFGYRAISDIRIVQGAVETPEAGAGQSKAAAAGSGRTQRRAGAGSTAAATGSGADTGARLDEVTDTRLRDALARLGASICTTD